MLAAEEGVSDELARSQRDGLLAVCHLGDCVRSDESVCVLRQSLSRGCRERVAVVVRRFARVEFVRFSLSNALVAME